MEGTFSQLYVQIVFSVKGRRRLILEDIRVPLEKYICGVVRNLGCKVLAIYCNPDHTHILIALSTAKSVADLAYAIKSNSSRWLRTTYPDLKDFSWQKGYSAFTYSRSALDRVARYIHNQPVRHRTVSVETEIRQMHEREDADDRMPDITDEWT